MWAEQETGAAFLSGHTVAFTSVASMCLLAGIISSISCVQRCVHLSNINKTTTTSFSTVLTFLILIFKSFGIFFLSLMAVEIFYCEDDPVLKGRKKEEKKKT